MNNNGLSNDQVAALLSQYGLNILPDKAKNSAFSLLFSQFKNVLSLLLIIAAITSYIIGDKIDTILITLILILNAFLGFWQEYKASRELAALRKLEVSTSRVIRDGKQIEIPSSNLVPGDLIVLESGDKIPADSRIVESYELTVNESALSGESLPVVKTLEKDDNEIYFGTIVITGRAKAQVLKTGTQTKFGQIALNLSDIQEEQTPLEKTLGDFSKKIGILALAVASFVFLIRISQGFSVGETFFSSTALLVAAVPEGFPTVITVALAVGVRRMYKRKTLVRKMSSVESLGATTIICSDKTGTLTKNEMSVKKVISKKTDLSELLKTAVLCNSASLVLKEDHGGFDILGDTTEGALLIWGKSQGLEAEMIKSEGKIIEELPFDLKRRRMSVLWEEKNHLTVFTKGAPESILPLCKLTESELTQITNEYEKLAQIGLRVLAFASLNTTTKKIKEEGLDYLGLIGIADTPRPEAKDTIQTAEKAGIRIVMVTGDNELTAKAIAEEVGLLKVGDEVLTGKQIQELTDAEFAERIKNVRIFARVIPEQKLRIIQTYQRLGEVVAVTGDGVNDALALKQAQVGVAMGTTGTDVAKEASDIVILDDNLKTLVIAIEQGRLIYQNILKVVKFLMAGNLAEILLIVLAVILGLPTPLLPAQILWINFVTDGLPAIALAVDPASNHLMKVPPRKPSSNLLNLTSVKFILSAGGFISLICLGIFYTLLNTTTLEIARSYAFTGIVVFQMVMIYLIRRHHGLFSNKYLFLSVAIVVTAQLLILLNPTLQQIFRVTSGF